MTGKPAGRLQQKKNRNPVRRENAPRVNAQFAVRALLGRTAIGESRALSGKILDPQLDDPPDATDSTGLPILVDRVT